MSSGVWYRTLVYLGLKEEPEEGYDDLPERGYGDEDVTVERYDDPPTRRFDLVDDPEAGRTSDDRGESNVRALRSSSRTRESSVRLAVVDIAVFDDVEEIGSRYRTGQPVLFDVSGADRATARRVIDFVSGLTYVSHGAVDRVGSRAFLLVPDGLELPDDEVRRLTTLGYRLPERDG